MTQLAQPSNSESPVGLLYSGGIDSSILLAHLLEQGERVQPIYIRSGLLWQDQELRAAASFLRAKSSPRLAELVELSLPLDDLYDGHWSLSGHGVPGAGTPDAAVYLPGRNPLLLIKARLWCQMHGIDRLALGCLASNPFADATDDFFRQFEAVLDQAASGHVELICPLAAYDKSRVMLLGQNCPLELTFSCLSPRAALQRSAMHGAALHCGECNKCAERQAAFRLAGRKDSTLYARRSSVA